MELEPPKQPSRPEVQAFVKKEVQSRLNRFYQINFFDRPRIVQSLKWGGGLLLAGWIASQFVEKVLVSSSSLGQWAGALAGLVLLVGMVILGRGLIIASRGLAARQLAWLAMRSELKAAMIKFLHPSFTYQERVSFPFEIYNQCRLFPRQKPDIARAEDGIRGTFAETSFSLFEILTQVKKRVRDGKGRTRIIHEDVFRGILFVADFNKNFIGMTTVTTDRLEKKVGRLARSLERLHDIVKDHDLVELENPEFEKHFVVRSTDPVEARYLLSTSFMERLLGLRTEMGVDLQVAFLNSQIVIALPHQHNFLDQSFNQIFAKNMNEQEVERGIEQMGAEIFSLLAIITDLKLNEKIWRHAA